MRTSTSLCDLDKIRNNCQNKQKYNRCDNSASHRSKNVNNPASASTHTKQQFDSRYFRTCCSLLHIKIATYVFCTLVLQEIVVGIFFLISRVNLKQSIIEERILVLLSCRFLQFPPLVMLYFGLFKCKRFYLLPFVLSQVTIGPFVDMQSFILFLKDSKNVALPFASMPMLNIVIPLLFYMAFLFVLMYIIFRCFVYYRALTIFCEKNRCQYSFGALPLCHGGKEMSEFSCSAGKHNTIITSAI